MRRHIASIALIWLAVGMAYSRVTTAYFCGYDDFIEVHRAAFEDRHEPARIFTTTHFGTAKYRPLNRALIYATYWMGGRGPLAFRLRNLGSHLLSIAMVYGIGWLLFDSAAVAATAAMLFGFYPLTNQVVAVAVWTIATADSLLLVALFLFLYSTRARRHQLGWLVSSMLAALIAIFTYESNIVICVFFFGFLLLSAWPKRLKIGRQFVVMLTAGVLLIGISFLTVRHLAVGSRSMQVPPPAIIAKNFAMDTAVFVLPLDSILAHDWFGTPLPSEMVNRRPRPGAVLTACLLALASAGAAWMWRKSLWERLRKVSWLEIAALALAVPISLAPFLFFAAHTSETYLYLPSAFFALIAGAFIWQFFQQRRTSLTVAAILVALWAAATWDRNERVLACGRTAQRILSSLPLARWEQGAWRIRLAEFPGEINSTRYGIYSYQGLSTIDVGDPSIPAAQCALQLVTGNERLWVEVVPAAEATGACPAAATCFRVHADGRVSEIENISGRTS